MKGLTAKKIDELLKALQESEPFPVWHGVRCKLVAPAEASLTMEIMKRARSGRLSNKDANGMLLQLTGQSLEVLAWLELRKAARE